MKTSSVKAAPLFIALSGSSIPTSAATDLDDQLLACSQIPQVMLRLECYDDLATRLDDGKKDDIAVTVCETSVLKSLISPSSYKRISADIYQNNVQIEYDAQNGYGALIRNYKICSYQYLNGEFYIDLSSYQPPELAQQIGFSLVIKNLSHFPASQSALVPASADVLVDQCIKQAKPDIPGHHLAPSDLLVKWDEAAFRVSFVGRAKEEKRVASCVVAGDTAILRTFETEQATPGKYYIPPGTLPPKAITKDLSDDEMLADCASRNALKPNASFDKKVLVDPSGEKTAYIRPTGREKPFEVAACVYAASEYKSGFKR